MKKLILFLCCFYLFGCSSDQLKQVNQIASVENICSGWAPTEFSGENLSFYFTPDGNANIVVPECTECKYGPTGADVCQCRQDCDEQFGPINPGGAGTSISWTACLQQCGSEPTPLANRGDTIPRIQFWVFVWHGQQTELPLDPTYGTRDDMAYGIFYNATAGDLLKIGTSGHGVKVFEQNYYDEWVAGTLCVWVWFEIRYTDRPVNEDFTCCFWSYPICPLNI